MTAYLWSSPCKVCTIAQLSPASPSPSPSLTWSSPIVGSVAAALIAAVIGGGVVKLWWDLKATESRALEAEKQKEIMKIKSECDSAIKDKDLMIQRIQAEHEDEIRDKEFEIKNLKAEVARLILESPPTLKEAYADLRAMNLQILEDSQKYVDRLKAELCEKDEQIQILRNQEEENALLIEKLEFEKQKLLASQKLFEKFIITLESLRDRMRAFQALVLWIETNREELVESSTGYVVSNFPQLLKNMPGEDEKELIVRFRHNVDDYVDWLKFSLENGCPINLSEVNLQPEVPGFALAKAFEFIKNQRAARELPDALADEIGTFISDLIAYFSSSAFRQ